jgi:hypothetical protein
MQVIAEGVSTLQADTRKMLSILESFSVDDLKAPGSQSLFAPGLAAQDVAARHTFFGGRLRERHLLDESLAGTGPRYVLVTGPSGIGKTALLSNWLKEVSRRSGVLSACYFAGWHSADEQTLLETLCRDLAALHKVGTTFSGSVSDLRLQLLSLLSKPLDSREQRLVVAIDGLDEVTLTPGAALVPASLSEDTLVVVGARQIADTDWREALALPPDTVEVLRLGPLGVGDIEDILTRAGVTPEAIRTLASPLQEITEGDPLYLRFLLEEARAAIQQGSPGLTRLAGFPKGLNGYLDLWWRKLTQLPRSNANFGPFREVRFVFSTPAPRKRKIVTNYDEYFP